MAILIVAASVTNTEYTTPGTYFDAVGNVVDIAHPPVKVVVERETGKFVLEPYGQSGVAGGENLDETLTIGNEATQDIVFMAPGVGIVLERPDGQKVRVTADNDNALLTTQI